MAHDEDGESAKRAEGLSRRVLDQHTAPALETKLAAAGHAALPPFYTHPETTGGLPTVAHSQI